ncbi:hypothetical protein V8D89_002079 [Ganoderma adspersum]
MAPPNNDGPALHRPINKSWKKANREEIAQALGLEYQKKTSAERLAKAIKAHLDKNPTLVNQARFQGLFAYQSNNTGGGGKVAWTSADKAAEDAVEGEKPQKDPTGAHKKLIDWNLPRDPPGQTTRLNRSTLRVTIVDPTRMGPVVALVSGTSSGIDMETPGGMTPYESIEDGEAGEVDETEKSGEDKDKEAVVVILLEHRSGLHIKPEIEEVHISPNTGLTVEHRCLDGGEKASFTKLSQLLPIALVLASTPTKNKGGHLSRAGATKDGSHIPLGSIEAILANPEVSPSRYLKSSQVNSYRLTREKIDDDESDLLICRLFVEPQESDIKSKQLSKVPNTSAASTQDCSDPSHTGWKGASSSSSSLPCHDKEGLVVYLRELLGGPEKTWPNLARKIGAVLRHVKALERAMAMLDNLGWEQSKGGFLIPDNYSDAEEFTGSRFIKEDVLAALRLGHSQAAGDAQLFWAEVMSKLPSLQAWYDDPDSPEAHTSSNMEIGAFKEWLKKQLGKLNKKCKKAKDSKVSATKKRAQLVSLDSDHAKGSKGRKKSKTAQYNSDELDESGVEDSD